MLIFGFGTLFYVSLLFTNAIAILHEERFLAQVGLSSSSNDESFKSKVSNMIKAVRTLLRGKNILNIGKYTLKSAASCFKYRCNRIRAAVGLIKYFFFLI
jgi:hypothetical protein